MYGNGCLLLVAISKLQYFGLPLSQIFDLGFKFRELKYKSKIWWTIYELSKSNNRRTAMSYRPCYEFLI